MTPDPQTAARVRAAVAELSRVLVDTLVILGAALLGIWLADPHLTFLRTV